MNPVVCERWSCRGLRVGGPRVVERALACLCLALGVVLSSAAPSLADDLADFEAARSLYDTQDYSRAVDAFQALVGTDPPRMTDPLLVLESRKYLAASLLFIGAQEDAKTQFRLLLAQEPNYALDPLAFPTEVLSLFDTVKAAVRRELEQKRQAEEAARKAAAEKARLSELVRRENLARLKGLAEAAETSETNSRWIATIPFGVGQFQNGHRGLGVALAMAESLSAGASIATFIAHQSLVNEHPAASDVDDTRRLESVLRTANYASFGVFLGLALIGIVDAHVRFVPARVRSRPRALPPDLERWVREQGLSYQPSGLLRF